MPAQRIERIAFEFGGHLLFPHEDRFAQRVGRSLLRRVDDLDDVEPRAHASSGNDSW